MWMAANSKGWASEAGKAALVAALCVGMVTPQGIAERPSDGPPTGPSSPTSTHKFYPLTDDQKVLHALNRLTFGPRPGDQERVSKMGLDAWFQEQLHPEKIDDSKLTAMLDRFPGLKLSQAKMRDKFPTEELIREQADRHIGIPSDPVGYAIHSDLIAKYFDERKEGAKKQENMGGEMAPHPAGFAKRKSTISDADLKAMWIELMPDPHGFKSKEEVAKIGNKQAPIPAMDKEDVEAVMALAPQQRYERLLGMDPLEMVAFRKAIKFERTHEVIDGMKPEQMEAVQAMNGPLQTIREEAAESRVDRDIYSERQLQAVMDDFWLNHFSVYAEKSQPEEYMTGPYERDSILPYSLGRFEEMLLTTAKSPAMLTFLDNWESVGPNSVKGKSGKGEYHGINENYARELLELHTFGVRCEVSAEHPASKLDPTCGGGYTQQDIIEIAKCFTGWTLEKTNSEKFGEGVFDASMHEPGEKHVLGQTIRENGPNEALQVLHMLATSPATATFVSTKLAMRFVSDTPDPALVARMADVFQKTAGDVKSVVSTMFHSPEFWAPNVYRAKVKTPIEFVASIVRASGAQVQNAAVLVQEVKTLGMPIYGRETPDGYSWANAQWVSSNSLVSRMNFALVFSGGKVSGLQPKWNSLLGYSDDSPLNSSPTPETELALENLLLGQPAADRTRSGVLTGYKNPAVQRASQRKFTGETTDEDGATLMSLASGEQGDSINTMAGLLLGSPDFQRR